MADSWAVKYRPQDFKSLTGNETNGSILREAVKRHQTPPAIFLAGTRGSGKCVDIDTLILTEKGIERARDIFDFSTLNEGDFAEFRYGFINMYGEVEYTSHAYYNGIKDCFKIISECGYSVTCTPNHPLYVYDQKADSFIWKLSSEISDSDFLCLPEKLIDLGILKKNEFGAVFNNGSYFCNALSHNPLQYLDGFYLDPVIAVAIEKDVVTVDFTLPETHSFLANGVVSHNTTSARIYAKAICCEHPNEDGEPCNECDACKDIMNRCYPDVIEVDAASENSVQGIRDLVKTLNYLPTRGDKKVIIIDECHSLSQAATNALLKTLEEPPEFVRFVFCTTEPQKVLETIRSRCLMFRFNDITTRDIEARLRYIADQEQVSVDNAALNAIARNSNGGMRDAIMLLEQAHLANVSGETIKPSNILELVGSVSVRDIQTLFMALKSGDQQQLLTWLDEERFAPIDILNSSISFLETVVLIKQGVSPAEFVSKDLVAGVMSLASTISFHDVTVMFEEFRGIIYDLRSLNGVSSNALFKLRMLGVTDKLTYQPVPNQTGQSMIQPQQSFIKLVKAEFNPERIPIPQKVAN